MTITMLRPNLTLCLLAFVWLGKVVSEGGQCPNSWTRFQESCYHFVQNTETWLEANEYCKIFGGYLAELTTRDEINFARREYTSRNLDTGVWIGLSDIFDEGVWMWTNDKTEALETNWARGEPGNSTQEDCAEIFTDNLWHDSVCNTQHYYMCEMSIDTNPVIG